MCGRAPLPGTVGESTASPRKTTHLMPAQLVGATFTRETYLAQLFGRNPRISSMRAPEGIATRTGKARMGPTVCGIVKRADR